MNKKITLIARIILGLIFFIFGLNGFLQFIPVPPLPEPALKLMGAFVESGYLMSFVKVSEVLAGFMLIIGLQVPLALLILAPIVINIFLFHLIVVGPTTIGMSVFIIVLMLILAKSYWENFRGIFK